MTYIQRTPLMTGVKLYTSNVTATTITAPAPTLTAPTVGNGFFDLGPFHNEQGFNGIILYLYGTRSSGDNEMMNARVTVWRQCNGVWIPTPLLTLTATQGAMVGVSGQAPSNTEYFADTIVLGVGSTTAAEAVSPADDTIAHLKLDTAGARWLQVQLARGTNASCNALCAGL